MEEPGQRCWDTLHFCGRTVFVFPNTMLFFPIQPSHSISKLLFIYLLFIYFIFFVGWGVWVVAELNDHDHW